ncbi:S-adenosylmethionine-dependent methyltransferase [Aspergillus luchuensis]|uniref:S-adenosylmethionine-dependent methyltransferase n=1 Tax=Aspergillus kawachii TaxID=1069201 RepID=A0A146FNV2_ASPKA|nr:S-adenosylmethionine-dependent methyltransferase [Aspergillus luchuensis]
MELVTVACRWGETAVGRKQWVTQSDNDQQAGHRTEARFVMRAIAAPRFICFDLLVRSIPALIVLLAGLLVLSVTDQALTKALDTTSPVIASNCEHCGRQSPLAQPRHSLLSPSDHSTL